MLRSIVMHQSAIPAKAGIQYEHQPVIPAFAEMADVLFAEDNEHFICGDGIQPSQ